MNVFGVNMVVEVLRLPRLSSTYGLDLTMVKDASESINPDNWAEEQAIAIKYYGNVKRRRTDYAVQDHKITKIITRPLL